MIASNLYPYCVLLIAFVFLFKCDIGPGTSGRDHCKNNKPGSISRPESSRADKAHCTNVLLVLNVASSDPDSQAFTDLYLAQCAAHFAALKKCDNESPLPWPIPIKY
jgi:hypothetical protein